MKFVLLSDEHGEVARKFGVPLRTGGKDVIKDIHGQEVRDARGRRVQGAAVSVQAASGEGPTATGTTDTQGEFRIRDAPTGEIAITVTSGDTRGITKTTMRPGDEVLGLSVELQ